MMVEKYMGRISGPLLDRIDLHIEVPPVPFEDLSKPGDGTGSEAMREQVFAVREVQAKRFGGAEAGRFRALDRKLWER